MRTNQAINLIDLAKLRMSCMIKMQNQRSSYEKMKLIVDSYENNSYMLVFSNKAGAVVQTKINKSFFSELKQLAQITE